MTGEKTPPAPPQFARAGASLKQLLDVIDERYEAQQLNVLTADERRAQLDRIIDNAVSLERRAVENLKGLSHSE